MEMINHIKWNIKNAKINKILINLLKNIYNTPNQPTKHVLFIYMVDKQQSPLKSLTKTFQDKNPRINQPVVIYILIIITNCASVLQIFVFFQMGLGIKQIINAAFWLTFFILDVSMVSILQLVPLKQAFRMFFIMDPILLTQLASSSSLIYMLYIMQARGWSNYLLFCFIILMNHLIAVNFRLMMVYVYWEKWQVVVYKFALTFVCSFFVFYGAYFIQSGYTITRFADTTVDSLIQSFIILFIVSNFGFYFQMYCKLSDYDGTAKMQTNYHLEAQNQEQEIFMQSHQNIELHQQLNQSNKNIPQNNENKL